MIFIVAMVILVLFHQLLNLAQVSLRIFEKYIADWREQPQLTLPPDKQAWTVGPGDATIELDVGAAVICTGFKEFDASRAKRLGYGRLPDVVTSFELEAMLRGSRPKVIAGVGVLGLLVILYLMVYKP